MHPTGQGHGIAGRFLGLEDEFANSQQSRIVILPVPFDRTTTYQKGADRGPAALIEASRNLELYDIETATEVYKLGIYTAPDIQASTSQQMVEAVESQVFQYLQKGQFVLTLGGEHSISLGAIRAHARQFPHLTVLQLDAHVDLQAAYEGNPWSHASVMARVKELRDVDRIVAVGIRSLSPEELNCIDQPRTFFAHDLQGSSNWIEKVINTLSNLVYITLDLDVLDCSLMPSTGTPEPGGLGWYELTTLLKRVMEQKQVVGCDIVELCPKDQHHAPDYVAAKLAYKLLSYRFANTWKGAQP